MNNVQVGMARGPQVFKALVLLSAGLVLDDSLLGGAGVRQEYTELHSKAGRAARDCDLHIVRPD